MSFDHVKLCTDCRLRNVELPDQDFRRVPCAAHVDLSLPEARKICQGGMFKPFTTGGRAAWRGY